jgi:hypothetical protein
VAHHHGSQEVGVSHCASRITRPGAVPLPAEKDANPAALTSSVAPAVLRKQTGSRRTEDQAVAATKGPQVVNGIAVAFMFLGVRPLTRFRSDEKRPSPMGKEELCLRTRAASL